MLKGECRLIAHVSLIYFSSALQLFRRFSSSAVGGSQWTICIGEEISTQKWRQRIWKQREREKRREKGWGRGMDGRERGEENHNGPAF